MSVPRILVVGGSTRAAADSIRRAGWIPICADLFADLDLRSTAEVVPVAQYPASLPSDVSHVRADGWFYCGALENHPEIVAQISKCNSSLGPLLGTSPAALKYVRDPVWLSNTLRSAGLPSLDVVSQSSPPPPDGKWLQKPLAGAGGRLIRIWDKAASRRPFLEPHYFQRRAAGIGLSVLFRAHNGEFEWLGMSRELTMSAAFQPSSEFVYCGSVGPLRLIHNREIDPELARPEAAHPNEVTDSKRSQLEQVDVTDDHTVQKQLASIAHLLINQVPGLKGLIGLDFRLDDDNVWLTEVNPRYTASVEVLELTTGLSFLNPKAIPTMTSSPSSFHPRPKRIAKQILYATQSMIAPDLSRFLPTADPWQVPIVADIPMPGIIVEAGWPICTILASAETSADRESSLQDHLAIIQRELNSQAT